MTRLKGRRIGNQEVGVLGYGSMSFGGIFGPTDEAESLATLDAAWAGGIRHFDTANIYGMGISETVIGTWMKSRGHRPVLATKAGIKSGPTREIDNSALYLRAELEASLRRLGTDHVALFYIHRRDIRVPLPELVATLRELIDEGKIGGYGLSEIAPATLRAAHALHPVTAVQNEYSLWTRLPELGLITACAELGCTFVAFSPLARGMLGQRAPAAPDDGFRGVNPRFTGENFRANCALIDGFRDFCRARGWTVSATALAWLLAQGPHILPIPGTRSATHLREWLVLPELSAADLTEIERLLPAGFAHGSRYGAAQGLGVEDYC